MELWEQLLGGAIALFVIFMFFPGVKATMEKSKNAKEKHWGTLLLLTVVLIAFVLLMVSSVQ